MSEQQVHPDGHVDYVCHGDHENGGVTCMFCAGGLSACTRCGAFEGAWPDECPGEKMTELQFNAVYAGTLNFRAGEWRDSECCQVMLPVRDRERFLREVDARAGR